MKNYYSICLLLFTINTIFAQVQLTLDINTTDPTASSSPRNLFVFDGQFYFTANDGNNGFELWASDGTSEGTILVRDIRNNGSSSPTGFFEYNGMLYFSANSGAGNVIHVTDGTMEGTLDLGLGTIAFSPVQLGGLVYIVNTIAGNILNTFDGLTFTEVADIGAGEETIIAGNTVAYDDRIFCYMNYSTEDAMFGNELYAYDPEAETFSLIGDINAGVGDASISNFTVLGTNLYFEALNVLWQTDGTSLGTEAVASANEITGINNLYAWEGQLYFEGDNGSGNELFSFDPNLLSAEVFGAENSIHIYPNPTKDRILFSTDMRSASYILSDLSGKTLAKGILDENEFIIHQPHGIYLLHLYKEQKKMIKKIVVK